MRRRMGGSWPRLVGPLVFSALLGVSGCSSPKSLGLAPKQEPPSAEQTAENRRTSTTPDPEAVGATTMFAATGPKKSSWFSLHRSQPVAAEDKPLQDQASSSKAPPSRLSNRAFQPFGRPPEADTTKRVATAPRDAAAPDAPKKSLAQSLRQVPSWLPFSRHKPKTADGPSVADTPARRTAPQSQLAYPNVVPSKYRDMDEGARGPAVAKDTSGSPSLVRPSRRPPPDPAPAPPQVQQVARAPVTHGPLFDSMAKASQSWRVKSSRPVATATEPSSTRQLVTEPHLKFTSPELAARERKARPKPTDLVKNMLRPAQPAAGAGGTPTPTEPAGTAAAPAATPASKIPHTNWMAKKSVTPSAATSDPSNASTAQRQEPVTAGTPANSASSTVVANTFRTETGLRTAATQVPSGAAANTGKSDRTEASPTLANRPPTSQVAAPTLTGNREKTPSRSSLVTNPFAAPRAERSAAGAPHQVAGRGAEHSVAVSHPAAPAVTLPDRSEIVARTESVGPDASAVAPRTLLAKTRSRARATIPTEAAAPLPDVATAPTDVATAPTEVTSAPTDVASAPTEVVTAPTDVASAPREVAAEETLAPLVDADTYRATLAKARNPQLAPVRTAARQPAPAASGSWISTYQQLIQGHARPTAPRPPAGSPQRKLSSDGEPELPELPAPILRR